MNTITVTPNSPEQEANILAYLQQLGLRPKLRKPKKTHYTLAEIIEEDGFDLETLRLEAKQLIADGWDGSE